MKGYDASDIYMMAKLKFLKDRIKEWRATDHPKEVKEMQELKRRIHEIDLLAGE